MDINRSMLIFLLALLVAMVLVVALMLIFAPDCEAAGNCTWRKSSSWFDVDQYGTEYCMCAYNCYDAWGNPTGPQCIRQGTIDYKTMVWFFRVFVVKTCLCPTPAWAGCR